MIATKHEPVVYNGDDEHAVICRVCYRLGKTATIRLPTFTATVTLWFAGDASTLVDIYAASKECDGNDAWMNAPALEPSKAREQKSVVG